MNELGLFFVVMWFIRLAQAQSRSGMFLSQQDINTLMQSQQGFPATVAKNFFLPSPPPPPTQSPESHGQGIVVGQGQQGGPGRVFTVDEHLQVPVQSVAGSRKSRQWQLESSRQRKVDVFKNMRMKASGGAMPSWHGGQTGLVNQDKQFQGIGKGKAELSKQAHLDISRQKDITFEGEALIPTSLLRDSGRGSADTQAGQAWLLNRAQQRGVAQGQAELADQTQLNISGQRDLTVEGSALVPTRGFSQGVAPWTKQARLQGVGIGQVELSKEAQLDVSGQRKFTVEGEAAIPTRLLRGSGQEIAPWGKRAGTAQQGQLKGISQGQTELSKQAQLELTRQRDLTVEGENLIPFGPLSEPGQEAVGNAGKIKNGGSRRVGVDISSKKGLDIEKQGQVSTSQQSLTGRDKPKKFTKTGLVDITKQAELSVSGQRDFAVEGEIKIPKAVLEAARKVQGGVAKEYQTRLARGGQTDAKRVSHLSRAGEARLGISRGEQQGISREAQIRLLRDQRVGPKHERQLDETHAAQLGLTGKKHIDITGKGQLDMARGAQFRMDHEAQLKLSPEAQVGISSEGQVSAASEGQIGGTRKGQFTLSREMELGVKRGIQREKQLKAIREGQVGAITDSHLGIGREAQRYGIRKGQRDTSREAQLDIPREGQLSATMQGELAGTHEGQPDITREAQLGIKRERQIDVLREGQLGAAREAQLGLSLEPQLGLKQEGKIDRSREVQLDIQRNQLGATAEGQPDATRERHLGMTRSAHAGTERQADMPSSAHLDISRERQLDASARQSVLLDLSGQKKRKGGIAVGEDESGRSALLDLSGVKSGNRQDKFLRSLRGFSRRQRNIGGGKIFEYSRVSVNIRCYADPQKGLSCGVELPDAQCKEKWDFPNPCTRKNLDMNITKFVHPYDTTKFLMCGEMGKLYIVQCPQLEIFHAGCGQCVDENAGMTASCEEPLTPQVSNPCSRRNIIDNKLYFSYPGNLSKYIHCDVWGKAWERICTPGEVWSQPDVSCVLPSLLNPCARVNADLVYLYPHPCNRRRYLRCDTNGVAYVDFCKGRGAFNEATQRCDPVGSFIGSDDQEFCDNHNFGFQPYRPGQLPADMINKPQGGFGPPLVSESTSRARLGQDSNQIPASNGVSYVRGDITIHPSKLREYKFKPNESYAEPCTAENIKEGRYHFRVMGDPHAFIQCDNNGMSHKMPCSSRGTDWFDPWTNTCVDGPIHGAENQINRPRRL